MAIRRHRLAQRRKAVGYTQEQLAEQLGVERTTVVRWESGDTQPQPWQWPNLADALKVSTEQLTDLLDGSSSTRAAAHHAPARASHPPATLPGDVVLSGQTATQLLDLLTRPATADGVVPALEEIDLTEMAQVIVMWATRLNPSISRRELLHKLSAAVTLAAAAPLFDIPDNERAHVRAVIAEPNRFSEPLLRYCEQAVGNLRHQGDVLGPQAALHSAIAHRQLVMTQAKAAPPHFRSRALSVAAEQNQLVGWFCFNLGDYRSAQRYYDDARSLAHDAHNTELVTYVLCSMSHLATWQGKPRIGIDHAVAAQAWAGHSGNRRAAGYAADVAARALAADQQAAQCQAALAAEHTALSIEEQDEPGLPLWYFYDESFYWATTSDCALRLGDPATALDSVTTALSLIDPANVHNYAFTMLIRAEALMQQGEIHEASGLIADVATLARVNTTRRIDLKIVELRSALAPWRRTKPVRQLDDVLTAYRLGESGNGNT